METTTLCAKCDQSAESLTEGGLCPDCHEQSEERRFEMIELARQQRGQEGLVEIDDDALLSEGNDNGCYVRAWVWTDFAGTKFDKEKGQPMSKPKSMSHPRTSETHCLTKEKGITKHEQTHPASLDVPLRL